MFVIQNINNLVVNGLLKATFGINSSQMTNLNLYYNLII